MSQKPETTDNLNDELAQRRQKLAGLREQGIAFPNDFRRDTLAADLHAQFDDVAKEELVSLGKTVKIAGRMMTRRIMGKASFATLQDMSGRIQIYAARDDLPTDVYNTQFKKWDLGDILAVEGVLFKTNTGELSVHASDVRLLTKALRPLPDKFHGLADQEVRYRQRYLDLISNEASKNTFKARSQIISFIRRFLEDRGFLEVETPMLQSIPGGASARPFCTHHNALDMDMYMRISPELYLKRLVVGGFEQVFEINKSFRNEGLSTRHNPEFTMLEFYWAYADYKDLIALTETMLSELTQKITGSTTITYGEQEISFKVPFACMSMKDAVLKYNPELDAAALETRKGLTHTAEKVGINVESAWGEGRLLTEIFEETAEHQLIQPTFITEYPAEVSPLARRNDSDPKTTDRFEFFVGGREIANGFSELNDAEDQSERFQAQVAQKESGDDEAMFFDADYITALEHGMPPTAGQGIGIDRLVMLLTNSPSIRDVLLFPAMKPQTGETKTSDQ